MPRSVAADAARRIAATALLALLLLPAPSPGVAATAEADHAPLVGTAGTSPAACRRQRPDGVAPAVLRPSLRAELRELCFEGYALLHSGVSRTALAASEHLTRRRIERARELERDDSFHVAEEVPEEERARLADYARSGFDRGHVAPSGDMPTASAQRESFTLANMVPQAPGSNRCLWEGIENAVRDLVEEEGEAWVLTGPVFAGDALQRLNGRVLVPTALFKAVFRPRAGAAAGGAVAAAYLAPNAPGMAWRAVSLRELGAIAGIDAFPSLPDAVRDRAAALPEPRPSNRYGSCDDQPDAPAASAGAPGGAAGGPTPASTSAPAPPSAPPSARAPAEAAGGGRTLLAVSALAALAAGLALWRVLGRR